MRTMEFEEKTVDDAINKALQHLRISRDQISVEILNEGARGLFGIGSKPARIRISYGRQDEPEDEPESRIPVAVPEEPARKPVRTVSPEPQAVAAHTPTPQVPDESADEDEDDEEPTRVVDEATLAQIAILAQDALHKLLEYLQVEYTVDVEKHADQILLNIHCDNENFLIGRRGTTLDAVQYLVNRIANKDSKDKVQVVLDTSDYRLNRKERLQKLALKLSRKVKMTGKPVTVSPMNPHDRRIIHLALQDDPTIRTMSKGTGFMRRITISSSKNSHRNRSKRPS